jgi:hypothetical protein
MKLGYCNNFNMFLIRIPGGMVIKLAEVVESGSLGGTMFPKPCIGTRAWNGDKHMYFQLRWSVVSYYISVQ